MTTTSPIFREQALRQLDNTNEPETNFHIVSASSWWWLLLAISSLSGILFWGVFSNISLFVNSNGIILTASQLTATETQIQQELHERQQQLAAHFKLLQQKRMLYRQQYLTAVDMQQAEQNYMAAKETLITFTNQGRANTLLSLFAPHPAAGTEILEALIFIPYEEGKKIQVGMPVWLLPTTLSALKYGYVQGKITTISPYPVSHEVIIAYLGNRNLADTFTANGAPFLAKVKLITDTHTLSGLRWTSKSGAPFPLAPGTSIQAKVIYQHQTPLQLLLRR